MRSTATEGASVPMDSSPTRVLVVAHRTAATPALLDAVRERAARGPSAFTLLVPNSAHGLHRVVDPENLHGFDEIIISTMPARVSKWLKLDLPSKLGGLGLPITTVTAKERAGTP